MKQRRPADMTEIYALRADTIDYFFPDRSKEIDFWDEQASVYGKDVLHLMCGTGEVSAGLAKRGYDVTGVDITGCMVYEAKERVKKEGIDNFEVIKEDIKYLHLDKKFDFIFISTGDFHHFIDKEEILSVLAKAYAHLKPGGTLALELFKLPDSDFKREEKKVRPFRSTPPGMVLWKRNYSSYHSESHMLEIVEELHVEEGDEVTDGEYEIQLRLLSEDEIEIYLRKVGFENFKKIKSGYPHLEELGTWVLLAEP